MESVTSRNSKSECVLKNKLVAYVDGENNLHGGIQGEEYAVPSAEATTAAPVIVEQAPEPEPAPEPAPAPVAVSQPAPAPAPAGDTTQIVIDVVVNHTGYPADFVESRPGLRR